MEESNKSAADDEALLSDVTDDVLEDKDEALTKQKAMNMANAMIVSSLFIIGWTIHSDACLQWAYSVFEIQVLGKNFSQLNISVYKDPCFHTNRTGSIVQKLNMAQSLSATFQTWSIALSLIPAFFTNLVIGAYSDRIGRKILFYGPLSGYALSMCCTCAVAHWELNINFTYIGQFVGGIFGSPVTMFMALYLYMADNTGENKSRSFAMVFSQIVCNICFALSHLATGYFINAEGYVWPMVTGLIIVIVSVFWTAIFLKESLPHKSAAPLVNLFQGIKTVFSFYFIKGNNPKYKRKDFIMLGIVFFLFGTCIGSSFKSMYLMNEPLCWNTKMIGYATTVEGMVQSFGSLVGMPLLQRYLNEGIICVIGLLSGATGRMVLAFADVDWMVLIAFTVDMLELLVLPVIRAIVSTMVPASKRGSVFSSIAVIEVATIAMAGAGATSMYSATVSIWRGFAYFVISCSLIVAVIIMLAYVIIVHRRPQMVIELLEDSSETPKGFIINKEPDDNDDQPLLA